jgi:nitrilase
VAQAEALVRDAARQGAQLVLLPEYFGIFGARATDKVAVRETDGAGPQQDFLARLARAHGIWMVGGTVPIAVADTARVRSALLVFDPTGRRVARYDKIHLFAFSQGEERYDEARTIEAGSEPVTFDAPCGRVGLSVCYDLRFPELYRSYRDIALILVPSAFTATTGIAHWHLLLRARAVENQCYVLAAAQGGLHPGGRRTYGHSVLIDPWHGRRRAGWSRLRHRRHRSRASHACAQASALAHRVLTKCANDHRPSSVPVADRHFEDSCPAPWGFGPIEIDGRKSSVRAPFDPRPIHTDPEARGPALRRTDRRLAHGKPHDARAGRQLSRARRFAASPGVDELRLPVRPATCFESGRPSWKRAARISPTAARARRSKS